MVTRINSQYFAPQKKMDWWKVEVDEGCLDGSEGKIKRFGEWFSADEQKVVEALTVFAGQFLKSNFDAFSNFRDMSGFSRLKYLSIPLDLVGVIDIKSISKEIEYLTISKPRVICEYWKKEHSPSFFEESFPILKSLSLPFSAKHFKNLYSEYLPHLKFVKMDLHEFDKTGVGISAFNKNTEIEAFSINDIKGHDILKRVRGSILALDMWAIAPLQFDFSHMAKFQELKYLRLSGNNSEFDFSVLHGLEKLEEIEIFSFKDVINLPEVCELKNLRKIRVEYIENKSAISAEIKTKIKTRFPDAEIVLEN